MQCPRCKTNIIAPQNKCPVCGSLLTNVINNDNSSKETSISNGILDPKNLAHYTKTIEKYKNKNKDTNIIIPVIFILIVLILIIIFAIFKIMS